MQTRQYSSLFAAALLAGAALDPLANAQNCTFDPDIAPGAGTVSDIIEFDIDEDGQLEIVAAGTLLGILPAGAMSYVAWLEPATGQWFDATGGIESGSVPESFAVHEDELYLTGGLRWGDPPVGVPERGVLARWNDSLEWERIGGEALGRGRAARTFEGTLYVGGAINAASLGGGFKNLLTYDLGADLWSEVSGDFVNFGSLTGDGIYDLEVYGNELVACGVFEAAVNDAGKTVPGTAGIVGWDGKQWQPVGQGIDIDPNCGPFCVPGSPRALELFEEDLIVTGNYSDILGFGTPVNSVARWNGKTWSAFINADGSSGISSSAYVEDLAVFDDGSGAQIFAAGNIMTAAGQPVANFVRWTGTNWESVGGGVGPGHPRALCAGSSPGLFVGGQFTFGYNTYLQMDGIESRGIARWGDCGSCEGDVDGDGEVGVDDRLAVLAAWEQSCSCPEDLNGDGIVDVNDLLIVLGAWGPCP